ncbi:mitofilin family membrane protein [Palleronia pelagia]|uniref:Inner membrane protein n=1 Tax=Palleronia pelagia TaxID=387096 RepID=A0A1H8F797_9RHOB|nr:mitofilin family membrane protein [Palleronia pelagia]SEN27609.1 inner membrane protein [Palleronia pelagia]
MTEAKTESTDTTRGGAEDTKADPTTETTATTTPETRSTGNDDSRAAHETSRTPFATLFLGGFIAAALGYGAAYYGEFGLFGAGEDEALVEVVAAQEARIDAIEAALGAPDEVTERLDASDAGLTELQQNFGSLAQNIDSLDERIGGVEAGLAGLAPGEDAEGQTAGVDLSMIEDLTDAQNSIQGQLSQRIDELAAQVAALEPGASTDSVAALEQRLADLSAQVDAQSEAIAGAETAAETETRRIAAQAAISEMRAAIESGAPFADAVGAFEDASGQDVPEALSAPAGQGVATLSSLQDSFDAAARDGLDASLAVTAGDGALSRIGAFVKAQTGARALSEQEGSGPDAVLSRAQARLNEGDLRAALTELDALPQEGRDAMSDWIARAETRLRASAALADLSPTSNAN